MTLAFSDLALYAIAVFILFITPGPVWVALLARAMSGGFQAAWPLALGVAIGDAVWPVLAVLGVSWVVNEIARYYGHPALCRGCGFPHNGSLVDTQGQCRFEQ
jgi:threonine/homoserine/homoserine lactone efflux protein